MRLAAAERGDWVELRVSDEGPGMSAEERARAFDRFWQSGEARQDGRPNGHFGLGLSIVRELVVGDGGDVALEPSATGGLEVVVGSTQRRAGAPSSRAGASALDGLRHLSVSARDRAVRSSGVGVTDAGRARPAPASVKRSQDLTGLVGHADPHLLQDAVALAVVVLAHAGW